MKHMQRVADQMVQECPDASSIRFRTGYHAIPSMRLVIKVLIGEAHNANTGIQFQKVSYVTNSSKSKVQLILCAA